MSTPALLARLEAAYLAARDARDRLDVARATGRPADATALEHEASATEAAARDALAAIDVADPSNGADHLDREAVRALEAMRRGFETAFEADADRLPVASEAAAGNGADEAAWAAAIEAGGDTLRLRLEGRYGLVAAALPVDGGTLSRPQILARLATEADAAARRRLFLALEPLWRTVDGDDGARSPYAALIRESAAAWSDGHSPVAANEAALGLAAGDVERWAVATLEAWRDAVATPAVDRGEPPIEPWDWWWNAGSTERALAASLPLDRIFEVNRHAHAALGADLHALNVRLDTTPRPDRPPVPVAFTTFGGRPARRPDGAWWPGEPTVLASYVDGGLGELNELVHETGHAIHLAAIRTRPSFADWPDSDALTEALAELVALDVAEPAWQRRWIPGAPRLTAAETIRWRYADVVLDAAWSLLELVLHADPGRRASDAWAEISSTYLGVAPHPEWPWWAMRGQLVQEPGYMANYAIGAVLAADLRAAIRSARGDWTDGDPGWYGWVSDRLYRFGLERGAGAVVQGMLGRPASAGALVAEIERARG